MNGRDTPKRKYYWMALAKTPTLTFKSSAGCVASIQYLSVAFAHHVHHQTSGADPIERKNQGGGTLHEPFFHHCWAEYFRRVYVCGPVLPCKVQYIPFISRHRIGTDPLNICFHKAPAALHNKRGEPEDQTKINEGGKIPESTHYLGKISVTEYSQPDTSESWSTRGVGGCASPRPKSREQLPSRANIPNVLCKP